MADEKGEAGKEWPPKEDFVDRFGRLRRRRRDLTNEVIAEHLGINPKTVSNWSGARIPRGKTLVKLARLFGVQSEWLVPEPEAAYPPLKPIVRNVASAVEERAKERTEKRRGA